MVPPTVGRELIFENKEKLFEKGRNGSSHGLLSKETKGFRSRSFTIDLRLIYFEFSLQSLCPSCKTEKGE